MTTDSVNAHQHHEDAIKEYLSLDAIPKMGIASLKKTAAFYQIELIDIPQLSDAQLRQCNWSDEQIASLRTPSSQSISQCKKLMQWLHAADNHHIVVHGDAHYPETLKHISRPPLFLCVAGDVSLLHKSQLGMVGTRAPSQYAKEVVNDLVASIASKIDVAITSGMALGIDALSHRASLDHDVPTLAVLGCGIDTIYPARHRQLYQDIKTRGAIVSEFIPGTAPHASLFPRRNRIISGLSDGLIVVEAKIKSGSLITARYALEQNKEVFAVPSAIYNPNAEGCHYLIKEGAKLTESAQDILDELPNLAKVEQNLDKVEKTQYESLASDPLLDSVSYSATSVDLIAKRSGMPISSVLTQLLQYELRGIVAPTPEGYVKLRG